jgi:hypothetical protein
MAIVVIHKETINDIGIMTSEKTRICQDVIKPIKLVIGNNNFIFIKIQDGAFACSFYEHNIQGTDYFESFRSSDL